MSPLCSSCRSEAEFTTTGTDRCSRCGERCDNCGGAMDRSAAEVAEQSPSEVPTSPGARAGDLTSGEALRDPVLAFILRMAAMGLVFAVVVLLL